jgi:TRAP-type C4-dicarboxylate transport system substrate-binding protein
MQVNEIDIDAFQEAARPIWDEIAPIAGEEFTQKVVDAAS